MAAKSSRDSIPTTLTAEKAEKLEEFRDHRHTDTPPIYQDKTHDDCRYTDRKGYLIEEMIRQNVHRCRSVVKCNTPGCTKRGWVNRLEDPTGVREFGDLQCLKPVDEGKVFCCKECPPPHPRPPGKNLIIFITPTEEEKEAISALQEDCAVELYTQVRVCNCQGCKDFKLFENHVERDTMVALGTYKYDRSNTQ